MNVKVNFCGRSIFYINAGSGISEIESKICEITGLDSKELYFLQNGKKVNPNSSTTSNADVNIELRQFGGKGGFGSMLRAIGAQIEKTTNREACRDLSGRRLRHINEEQRLKTWLDTQNNRDPVVDDKQKRKIDKLQAKPKHVFKDEAYEQARSDLTKNIAESVEEGFKKAAAMEELHISNKRPCSSMNDNGKIIKRKKKGPMWLDDISSSSDTSDSVASDTDVDAESAISCS